MLNNQIRVTDLETAWLDAFDAQDKLCAECLKGEGLLCSGIRPVWLEEDSIRDGVLATSHAPCQKLTAINVRSAITGRVRRACIPPSVAISLLKAGEYPEVEKDEYGQILVNGEPIPVVSTGEPSLQTTKKLFALATGCCVEGLSVKCVFPQWWYNQPYWTWEELGFADCYDADLVVVERVESNGGSDTARDKLFSMLFARISAQMPTIATMGAGAVGKTEMENEILQEIQGWEPLKL